MKLFTGHNFPDFATASFARIQERISTDNFMALIRQQFETTDELEVVHSRHKASLEKLARDALLNIFGFTATDGLGLKLEIVADISEIGKEMPDYRKQRQVAIDPAIQPEFTKRDLMNFMIHGAASVVQDYFHLLKEQLDKLDPDIFLKSRHLMLTSDAIMHQLQLEMHQSAVKDKMLGGISWLSKDNEQININAKALTFPLLLHEGAKGIMEYLALYGQPQDSKVATEILGIVDHPDSELKYLRQGSEVWRKVWKKMEGENAREKTANLIKLIQLPALEFNQRVLNILDK